MPVWKKNIFVRVIKTRIGREGKTKGELILDYSALTEDEKTEILKAI